MEHRTNKMIGTKEPATEFLRFGNGPVTPANGTAGWEKGAIFANTADGKVYVNGGTAESASFAALASGSDATTAATDAATSVLKGKGDSLPDAADNIGQLFIRTGATSPGIYMSSGTTTPGWTLIAEKNA